MAKKPNVRQFPKRECREMLTAFLEALFGGWTGQPQATELFTTAVSHLTTAQSATYPSLGPNYSPAHQISAQFGDLIVPSAVNSQANGDIPAGIIHHTAQTPGEQVGRSRRWRPRCAAPSTIFLASGEFLSGGARAFPRFTWERLLPRFAGKERREASARQGS
jgi:hypothetical protein